VFWLWTAEKHWMLDLDSPWVVFNNFCIKITHFQKVLSLSGHIAHSAWMRTIATDVFVTDIYEPITKFTIKIMPILASGRYSQPYSHKFLPEIKGIVFIGTHYTR